MKQPLLFLSVLSAFAIYFAGPTCLDARTLRDINAIPTEVLQRSVSPAFFKSLIISPVDGWIAVRGQLVGTHLSGRRVVHSELKGAYDSLALQIAGETELKGYNSIGLLNRSVPVLVHTLIYRIADGTMVLSFPTFDSPGENQLRYYGCARLAVLKKDNTWVYIKGPPGLEGKGWAVRRGLADSFEGVMKLEKITGLSGFSPGG
jgi:hypothetical protein